MAKTNKDNKDPNIGTGGQATEATPTPTVNDPQQGDVPNEDASSEATKATPTPTVNDPQQGGVPNGDVILVSPADAEREKRKVDVLAARQLMNRYNVSRIYRVGSYWFADLRAAEDVKATTPSAKIEVFKRDE